MSCIVLQGMHACMRPPSADMEWWYLAAVASQWRCALTARAVHGRVHLSPPTPRAASLVALYNHDAEEPLSAPLMYGLVPEQLPRIVPHLIHTSSLAGGRQHRHTIYLRFCCT